MGLSIDSIGQPLCFMPIASYFNYCSTVIELDVKDSDASGGSFIVQNCFDYSGFFVFPYEVDCCSFKVCEEFCRDFDGDCVEPIDCF